MLDPEVVGDDEALGEAVDAVVRSNAYAGARQSEIVTYQDALRAALDDEGEWRIFLRLDELANARSSELLLVVARWAYGEGVRYGGSL